MCFFSVNQRVRKAYPYFVLLVIGFIIFCKIEIVEIDFEFLKYIVVGRDSLLWIFSGSGMYYISLFIEKIVTTNVKQRILTLILPLVMAVTTFALDPSVYSVKSVMNYLFIFVLLFSLVTGFRELKVSEDNAFVVIGNHSYVIYLIHATLLGAVFYLMNATGV